MSQAMGAPLRFNDVHYETLEEARAAREHTEHAFGVRLPKSTEELRLETEANARQEAAR